MSKATIVKIPESQLGVALHTALRKACDTEATTLTWNIINIIKQGWLDYLDLVGSEWDRVKTKQEAIELLQSSAEELEFGCSERNSLKLSFRYFDSDDWEVFGAYLFYEAK